MPANGPDPWQTRQARGRGVLWRVAPEASAAPVPNRLRSAAPAPNTLRRPATRPATVTGPTSPRTTAVQGAAAAPRVRSDRAVGWLIVIGLATAAVVAAGRLAAQEPVDIAGPGMRSVAFVISPIIALGAAWATVLVVGMLAALHLLAFRLGELGWTLATAVIGAPVLYLGVLLVISPLLEQNPASPAASSAAWTLASLALVALPIAAGVVYALLVMALRRRKRRAAAELAEWRPLAG